MKNTLCCLVQNRLGALDRILGALTHRGFMPESFMSSKDGQSDRLHVMFTFECSDEKTLEKLVKFLYKQIHVIEIRQMFTASEVMVADAEASTANADRTPVLNNVAPIFKPVYVERRISHANR